MTDRLLVVDDDLTVGIMIEAMLNIVTEQFTSVDQINSRIRLKQPIASFVDLHLPGTVDGIQTIKHLRTRFKPHPIIMITADTSETHLVQAFEAGAADFINKPIRRSELRARLKARLDDYLQMSASHVVKHEDLVLDFLKQELRGPNQDVSLTKSEVLAALALMNAHGATVSKNTIINQVWRRSTVTENSLDRKISDLRKLLAEIGSTCEIVTEYKKGYRIARKS